MVICLRLDDLGRFVVLVAAVVVATMSSHPTALPVAHSSTALFGVDDNSMACLRDDARLGATLSSYCTACKGKQSVWLYLIFFLA